MRIGLGLSQYGPFANPEAVVSVARSAEELGFDSLWVGDRILSPLRPRDPYPGGEMPEAYRTFLDPLAVLTMAATVTTRVRLGTSVLNAPWYPPVLLARSLTTLDRLSDGRVDVGLGIGWSRDEYAAVGVPWHERGTRLDQTLDVFDAVWGPDPVTHTAGPWEIPASHVGPKPVQRPRPPVYLGGFSAVALRRIGRRADGWLAPGLPLQMLTGMWSGVRDAATACGRDPDALRIVLRANPVIVEAPAPARHVPHTGTVEQVAQYFLTAHQAGVAEVFADFQQTAGSVSELLDLAGRLLRALRAG